LLVFLADHETFDRAEFQAFLGLPHQASARKLLMRLERLGLIIQEDIVIKNGACAKVWRVAPEALEALHEVENG